MSVGATLFTPGALPWAQDRKCQESPVAFEMRLSSQIGLQGSLGLKFEG